MDGNGRWARRRGHPASFGHRAGVRAIKRVLEGCEELGVKVEVKNMNSFRAVYLALQHEIERQAAALQAQLDQMKASLRQAEEKIGVRPGQSFDLNKIPEVGNARVALDLAEKNLRRSEKLIESGDISRSVYDQQKAQRDQLREVYEGALSLGRQNYAAVMTARANVASAESQLNLARRNLSYAAVLAPIDGFVSERTADVGEYVSTTSKVATIVRINPLRVRIDIPEQAIPEISVGQSVSVTTSAWPSLPNATPSGGNPRAKVCRANPERLMTVSAFFDEPGAKKLPKCATTRYWPSGDSESDPGCGATL